ncbi:MAG: vancomycin resistance histidine kinase VanS, partial [Clostridiales bacterium]|nr:vancomycin resistance histidine kinase VanS [Clostridiales bacterium]
MKRRGIFIKVFIYTSIFIALLVCVTVVVFSQQFVSFYNSSQLQQITNSYQRLVEELQNSPND